MSAARQVVRVALAGDTMLGREVGERIRREPGAPLFDPELAELVRTADLFVVNLECCISDRGTPWPDPAKPFFFRAPPAAARVLAELGVDCVTLANNHALDFGADALLDTIEHLAAAGIACAGAGASAADARAPALLEAAGLRLAVVSASDHPRYFAAGDGSPGIAYAPLRRGVPAWLRATVASGRERADAVLASPHWGPNMVPAPVRHVRRAAEALLAAGATLVAGHSAHVFHGAQGAVLYDLGDFIDDYAVDPELRNDLGLLWMVTFEDARPQLVEVFPLALDYCHTRLARGDELAAAAGRLRRACAALGTEVREEDGRLAMRVS